MPSIRPFYAKPKLADVLESISREGPDVFHKGDVAKSIVSEMQINGGFLSSKDLENYRPFVWKDGLEFPCRDCSVRVPPFACGGITTAMTLKLLNGFKVFRMGHNYLEMLHAYISCARLAYADRFAYIADHELVDVPWRGLLSEAYTIRRHNSISEQRLNTFEPGNPWTEEGRSQQQHLPASLTSVLSTARVTQFHSPTQSGLGLDPASYLREPA